MGLPGRKSLEIVSSERGTQNVTLRLVAAHRLLLTPHIAGVTRQAYALLFRSAWENVERVLAKGLAPLNRVY